MMRRAPSLPASVPRERGVAAIELALLLVPLVLLAFGIAEAGRALVQYNTLVKSVRDATRYLTTVQPGTGFDVARCLAVHGNPDCSGEALVPGLAVANVGICDSTNCQSTHRDVPATGNGTTATGTVNLVTVSVHDYGFVSTVALPLPSFTFAPIANTMRQAL